MRSDAATSAAPAGDSGADMLKPLAVELDAWVEGEIGSRSLNAHAERERRDILRTPFERRPPTWIQSAVTHNPAERQGRDETSQQAELERQAIDYMLAESRRERGAAHRAGSDESDDSSWLRKLIPYRLIRFIKDNREWVAVLGLAALLGVGLATGFARRPGGGEVAGRRSGR